MKRYTATGETRQLAKHRFLRNGANKPFVISGSYIHFVSTLQLKPQPGGCRRGEQGKYGVTGQETSGSPASSPVPLVPRTDICRVRRSGCPALLRSSPPSQDLVDLWSEQKEIVTADPPVLVNVSERLELLLFSASPKESVDVGGGPYENCFTLSANSGLGV